MKDNRVKLFKKSKGKTALFLALLMVLNLAPLPENAGEGLVSAFVNNITNIGRLAGNRINSVLAADDRDYLLKEGNFEVNLANGGSRDPYTLIQDTNTLVLTSVLKNPPKTTQAVSGAKIILNDTSENVVKAEVTTAASLLKEEQEVSRYPVVFRLQELTTTSAFLLR